MTTHRPSSRAKRNAIAELHKVRLDRLLTYDQFALQVGLSRRNLFRLMNDPTAGMQDTTYARIRRYLDAVATETASGVGA